VTGAFTELAHKVGASLQESVAANARTTGDTVKPIVEQAMGQVVRESERIQQRLAEAAHEQAASLQQVQQRLGEVAQEQVASLQQVQQRLADVTQDQVGSLQQGVAQLLEETRAQNTEHAKERDEAEGRWLQQHGERMDALAQLWRTEVGALRAQESERGDAAVQRLAQLEEAVARHLATLGAALEAPITRLLHTASEEPQAAAGVIAQLREEMGRVTERDNLALQERALLLERLGALVGSLEQASGEQRTAIEAMVASATSVLEQSHERFSQVLEAQAGQASGVAAQATASAVELAAVADAFGESVRLFQASHEKLTETLQRVEASLQKSTARSDEQLAYYVAQAREVIDLSITSQQGLVESLRQLKGRDKPSPVAEGVA
jgi:3-phosphoglycerate kinase